MKIKQKLFIQSKEVCHHHFDFGRDSKTSRGVYGRRSEGCRCTLIGGCWHGEAGGELTRNRHPM